MSTRKADKGVQFRTPLNSIHGDDMGLKPPPLSPSLRRRWSSTHTQFTGGTLDPGCLGDRHMICPVPRVHKIQIFQQQEGLAQSFTSIYTAKKSTNARFQDIDGSAVATSLVLEMLYEIKVNAGEYQFIGIAFGNSSY